jgi:hypothetical protein
MMNERIKELYKQAGFTVARGWSLKDTVPEDVFIANVCVSNEMKKFAELIVKECVTVAMRAVSDDEPKEAWYLIQEHFGVEE